MIKHRRLSKKTAVAVLASAILIGTSTTAFAYVDPGAEQTAQSQTSETAPDDSGQEAAPDEGTSEGDTVLEETDETGTAFSTPGNAQVQDDITEDSTKEFLTITTKNNNTFYLVIDRSASTENVYMLSQIDESDLQEFLDSGAVISEETSVPSVVLEENETLLLPQLMRKSRLRKKGRKMHLQGTLRVFWQFFFLPAQRLGLTTILRSERKRLRPRKKIPKGWNSATDWRQWMNGKKTRTIMNNDLSGRGCIIASPC